MPRYFCTLFNSGYLVKGLAMVQSLVRNCPEAQIYVLCMDRKTQALLTQMRLPFVICIALEDIEDERLLQAKQDRSVAEYCWTLSSCFTWQVMQSNPSIDFVTYLDADLLFYSALEPIFEEIDCSSIAIIEHRFTPRLQDREVNGRFCVEWVSFRRDSEGMTCLSRWREQCIEWCYYRLEDKRMGDQKYLDEWPERFSSCHIIEHAGAGIAPWNYAQYEFGKDAEGSITVEGSPLIFYHFHQFQMLANGDFSRLSSFYTSECLEPSAIYETYESALTDALQHLRKLDREFADGLIAAPGFDIRRLLTKFVPRKLKDLIRSLFAQENT